MSKTFQCIADTVATKQPVKASQLPANEKVSYKAGRVIPYVSLKDANDQYVLVDMDYDAGSWYFYKPDTSLDEEPAEAAGAQDWSESELTQKVIAKAKELELPLKTQWAYMMATIQWETAGTFKPVREAFWMGEEWRKTHLRYYPYYGRGYVQLTWESNYRKFSNLLHIDLVKDPDLALKPEVALFVLVYGFKHGSFTGKTLEEYVNDQQTDYVNARRCINGLDRAEKIAAIAQKQQDKL